MRSRTVQPTISTLLLAILLGVVVGILPGLGWLQTSAAESVAWQHFDVTLDVQTDGSYHVTERQEIRFSGGSFSGGFVT